VFPPSLKRRLENETRFEASLRCRTGPNSAIFCQNPAEYGTKAGPFAADFMRTGQVLELGHHPNERRTQVGRQATASQKGQKEAKADPKQANCGRLVVGQWGQNRPKPNVVKAIVMRKITQETMTQTHGEYPFIFQWVGTTWRPDFGRI